MITPALILRAVPGHAQATVTAQKFEAARIRFGVTDARSVAALIANCTVESGLVPAREDGFYRSAAHLRAVFPGTFDPAHGGKYAAGSYVQNPEKLFSLVYASKGGNGGVASGDGYRYRGGGFIQTTFEEGYQRTGDLIGEDLKGHPELIEQIGVSALAACAYWTRLSGANACAQHGDIAGTRRAVNGPAMLELDQMLAVYTSILPLARA